MGVEAWWLFSGDLRVGGTHLIYVHLVLDVGSGRAMDLARTIVPLRSCQLQLKIIRASPRCTAPRPPRNGGSFREICENGVRSAG